MMETTEQEKKTKKKKNMVRKLHQEWVAIPCKETDICNRLSRAQMKRIMCLLLHAVLLFYFFFLYIYTMWMYIAYMVWNIYI